MNFAKITFYPGVDFACNQTSTTQELSINIVYFYSGEVVTRLKIFLHVGTP